MAFSFTAVQPIGTAIADQIDSWKWGHRKTPNLVWVSLLPTLTIPCTVLTGDPIKYRGPTTLAIYASPSALRQAYSISVKTRKCRLAFGGGIEPPALQHGDTAGPGR